MTEHKSRPLSNIADPAPAGDWDKRLASYVRFIGEHGRPPSSYSADPFERAMTRWLNNQRASLRNGVLLREKAAKLDRLLPGWSSPNWIRPSWDQMLLRVIQFKFEQERWPLRESPERQERALANWLYRQRRSGTASPDLNQRERMARLDKNLAGWRISNSRRRRDDRWNSQLQRLLDHINQHGILPVLAPSRSKEEISLGKWLESQRQALEAGRLQPEQSARLDALVPGWLRYWRV